MTPVKFPDWGVTDYAKMLALVYVKCLNPLEILALRVVTVHQCMGVYLMCTQLWNVISGNLKLHGISFNRLTAS